MSLLFRFAKLPDYYSSSSSTHPNPTPPHPTSTSSSSSTTTNPPLPPSPTTPPPHLFTFIVTRSVTRDLYRDVTSKEFHYGHHKWAITFSRMEKVLGVYLVLRSPSEHLRVYVDFSFTLLNREHFSANEGFAGKGVKFTVESPAQGSRRLLPVADLYTRNFADRNGEFQLELQMSNIRTVFETDLRLPSLIQHQHHSPLHHPHPHPHPHPHHHHHHTHPTTPTPTTQQPTNILKTDSTYFNFGGFDWNLSLYPYGRDGSSPDRLFICLNRLSGFELFHQCRIRYVATLSRGGDSSSSSHSVNSGLLDDISDPNGKCYGWSPRVSVRELIGGGSGRSNGGGGVQATTIHIHLELLTANALSEVCLPVPPPPPPVIGGGGGVEFGGGIGVGVGGVVDGDVAALGSASFAVETFDKDKQAWVLEADCLSPTLRLRLTYKDMTLIPRNHLRYVSWSAYLLRYNTKTGLLDPIAATHAPYSNYYAQLAEGESDDGIMMETDVTVKEIRDPTSFYVNERREVRVQIEWLASYLLFQSTYHMYDDVTRVHNYQMRKEITALQSENYTLERQLFSYQKSLAYAHHHQQQVQVQARPPRPQQQQQEHAPTAAASAAPPIPTTGTKEKKRIYQEDDEEEDEEDDYDEDDYNRGRSGENKGRMLLERNLSTDTEYA